MSDCKNKFLALNRGSANGYAVTVCIQYRTDTNWSWVAIRYPLEISSILRPAPVLKDFNGCNWSEIYDWVREYLANNPADGFALY